MTFNENTIVSSPHLAQRNTSALSSLMIQPKERQHHFKY